MRAPAFFLKFSKSQRRGILALLLLITLVQGAYYVLALQGVGETEKASEEEKQWLALQPRIDSLKAAALQHKGEKKIYPFNPNFITDYKGYALGMTTRQIDKLHAFRQSGRFVNSAADFKAVTGVHDTLLEKISPYFKFPDWVLKKQQRDATAKPSPHSPVAAAPAMSNAEKKVIAKDINEAMEEDLVAVYGIGPAFAKKILRKRAVLGAFVTMEQMAEFPEFSPGAVAGLQKHFRVGANPAVERININNASLNQLASFPYFNKSIARAIITQRSMKGKLTAVDDLLKINQFPVDKEKIIALYLEF